MLSCEYDSMWLISCFTIGRGRTMWNEGYYNDKEETKLVCDVTKRDAY